MMKFPATPLCAALLLGGLAACSGGPGKDEVKALLEAQYAAIGVARLVESIEVLGCEKDGSRYACDVSVTMGKSILNAEPITQASRLHVIKTDKGWVLTR